MVLICPKSESDIKKETAQNKIKNRVVKKKKAIMRKFQVLSLPF